MSAIPLEICIECTTPAATRQAVAAAYAGGAERVELCAAMTQDGLTPPAEVLLPARQAFANLTGMLVMIRPRGGDFCYSSAEYAQMLNQLDWAQAAGADGVVLGVLHPDGRVDLARTRHLVQAARSRQLSVTFHRAFDAVQDPHQALEALIDLGFTRLLTSGTPWGSGQGLKDGVARINALLDQAGGRIELVLGGGVNAGMIGTLLAQLHPGSISVHAYSGVLRQGLVDQVLVQQLADQLANFR